MVSKSLGKRLGFSGVRELTYEKDRDPDATDTRGIAPAVLTPAAILQP
jgi:hypothetical protein